METISMVALAVIATAQVVKMAVVLSEVRQTRAHRAQMLEQALALSSVSQRAFAMASEGVSRPPLGRVDGGMS